MLLQRAGQEGSSAYFAGYLFLASLGSQHLLVLLRLVSGQLSSGNHLVAGVAAHWQLL